MISAVEFRNTYIGKAIDVDGAAGVQCVDLFKQCCYLAGKKAFALGGSGYAYEIINRFDALGLVTYFDKVSLSDAQYGDWCVWDKGSKEAANSHVAMFEKRDGSSRAIFLGQNQGGKNGAANEISISTDGIIGVLRLKQWKTSISKTISEIAKEVIAGKWGNGEERQKALEAAGYDYDEVQAEVNKQIGSTTNSTSSNGCPFKSSGTVEALYDNIRVRTSPSISKGDTGSRYNKGMTLNYQSIVSADGWYWAKYKSYGGETHYCALCKTDGSSKYWKQK